MSLPFFKRPEPIRLGGGDTLKLPGDFDEAFRKLSEDRSLEPGKVWRVSDPSSPSYMPIPPREPATALIALAERLFVEMFSKQDSLICVPDELAERAWEMAEAFVRALHKRTK